MIEHTYIWLLKQSQNRHYDTYDSVVVCAKTEDEAKKITPDGFPMGTRSSILNWVTGPEDIQAEKLGVTKIENDGRVIIASYNAG